MHSHSGQYCSHAHGTLSELVQNAIKFKVYGLSEHMPRVRTCDLYPEENEAKLSILGLFRMFDDFVKEARRLQDVYKDQVVLLVGMETEYIHGPLDDVSLLVDPVTLEYIRNRQLDCSDEEEPLVTEEMLRMGSLQLVEYLREKYKLDYIVGSVHHTNEHWIDYNMDRYINAVEQLKIKHNLSSDEQATDQLFQDYFDAQYDMLVKLHPQVVGHFDLIRIYSPNHTISDVCFDKMKRNVDVIVEYGGIIEINSRAFKKGLPCPYPFQDILDYMVFKNALFTLSDDAHGPNDVGMHYEKTIEYLERNGISRLHYPCSVNGKPGVSFICIG